jgi:hypothetical protein
MNDHEPDFIELRFNGPDYSAGHDNIRLVGQMKRVFHAMEDGEWWTLDELAFATRDPHASISAQLRHLRKLRFGAHTVEKRPRGNREHGLFEYRLLINPHTKRLFVEALQLCSKS